MRRAALALAVGAVLLVLAVRARRDIPVEPRRPAPLAVVELSSAPAEEVVRHAPPATKRPANVVAEAAAPAPRAVEASTSDVWGVVTLDGDRPATKRLKGIQADSQCAALHGELPMSDDLVVDAERRVRWAVVHVVKGLGERRFDAPTAPVQLEQIGCRYVPHVLGVRVDQPVAIVNRDLLLHNVHALPFANRGFNFAQVGRNETLRSFSRPEIFQVRCDVHPWMSAWLAVFDHPYFAVTGEDGKFRIPRLPPGRYELAAWHEGLKSETREVDLGDAEVRLDFLLRRR